MARSPDGTTAAPAACEGLTADESGFIQGLEGVIDRALQGVRPGERFVYGIHDQLAPRIAECLVRRYLAAGWAEAMLLPGATGSAMLVLAP
jgi:hypothetical protein